MDGLLSMWIGRLMKEIQLSFQKCDTFRYIRVTLGQYSSYVSCTHTLSFNPGQQSVGAGPSSARTVQVPPTSTNIWRPTSKPNIGSLVENANFQCKERMRCCGSTAFRHRYQGHDCNNSRMEYPYNMYSRIQMLRIELLCNWACMPIWNFISEITSVAT